MNRVAFWATAIFCGISIHITTQYIADRHYAAPDADALHAKAVKLHRWAAWAELCAVRDEAQARRLDRIDKIMERGIK